MRAREKESEVHKRKNNINQMFSIQFWSCQISHYLMDLDTHTQTGSEKGKITLCVVLFRDDTIFKGYQMANTAPNWLMVTSEL